MGGQDVPKHLLKSEKGWHEDDKCNDTCCVLGRCHCGPLVVGGDTVTPTDALLYRDVLIAYLFQKAKVADWHGVSDAANDLRELEAVYPHLMSTPVGRPA